MGAPGDQSRLNRQQKIRLTNTLFAAAGGVVLSAVLIGLFIADALLVPGSVLAAYFCVFWLGNAAIVVAIASGLNLRFNDPALSLLQMYWAMTVSIIALLFSSEFDVGIYLLLMLILVFGIFRVSVRQFNIIAIYVVLALLVAHLVRVRWLDPTASLTRTLLPWLVFSFCTIILTRLCQSMVLLRNRLRQKNDELQAALAAKQQFMANMSHEIRTPMNGVLGMLDIVMRDDMPSKQRRYLSIAQSSGASLLALINDILDFSKIEAGKLDIHPQAFELTPFIGEILDAFSAKAEAQGVELVVDIHADTPLWITTDPMRLRQILNNLLGNALKFTERGEVVLEVASMAAADSYQLVWWVSDSGIGIDSDDLDKLFLSFSQVDASASRAYGGAGLGLAICKQLCLLMGGDIRVSSTLGQGSCFEFNLPVQVAEAPREHALEERSAFAGKRVLVVEDSVIHRRVLQDQLQHGGASVVAAATANEALSHLDQAANAGGFDLAIVDVQMPELNGLALAQQVRAQPHWQNLPLVLLSSAMDDESESSCHALAACRFLRKPVLPGRLHRAVIEALDSRGPVFAAGTAVVKSEGASALVPAGVRILLAEDSPTNQQVAAATLAALGCRVDIVDTGERAVHTVAEAFARGEGFDIVLMDCQMPVMDGYEATRRIRALPRAGSGVPIIAITANAMPSDRDRCLAAGMNDYIAKPFQFDALQATLAHWLNPIGGDGTVTQRAPTANAEGAQVQVCWNAQALRKLVRKDERMVELLQSFLAGADATEKAIIDALEAEDGPQALRLIHSLKGASANLGARALPAALERLERQLRSGEQGPATHGASIVRKHMGELRAEMAAFLQRA